MIKSISNLSCYLYDFRPTDTVFQQAAFIFAQSSECSVLFSARRGTPNRFAAYTPRCDVPHAIGGQLRLNIKWSRLRFLASIRWDCEPWRIRRNTLWRPQARTLPCLGWKFDRKMDNWMPLIASKSDLPNFRLSDILFKPVWVALLWTAYAVSATLPPP